MDEKVLAVWRRRQWLAQMRAHALACAPFVRHLCESEGSFTAAAACLGCSRRYVGRLTLGMAAPNQALTKRLLKMGFLLTTQHPGPWKPGQGQTAGTPTKAHAEAQESRGGWGDYTEPDRHHDSPEELAKAFSEGKARGRAIRASFDWLMDGLAVRQAAEQERRERGGLVPLAVARRRQRCEAAPDAG